MVDINNDDHVVDINNDDQEQSRDINDDISI